MAPVIIASLIGAGTSLYGTAKAEQAAADQRDDLAKKEEEARLEADRIARDTRPEAESASAIKFGTQDNGEIGSTSDFLVPTQSTSLGTSSATSGLGFS